METSEKKSISGGYTGKLSLVNPNWKRDLHLNTNIIITTLRTEKLSLNTLNNTQLSIFKSL